MGFLKDMIRDMGVGLGIIKPTPAQASAIAAAKAEMKRTGEDHAYIDYLDGDEMRVMSVDIKGMAISFPKED